MTTAEAALRLSLGPRTVRDLIASGVLRAEREGQRWLIDAASVREEEARRCGHDESGRHLLGLDGEQSGTQVRPSVIAPVPARADSLDPSLGLDARDSFVLEGRRRMHRSLAALVLFVAGLLLLMSVALARASSAEFLQPSEPVSASGVQRPVAQGAADDEALFGRAPLVLLMVSGAGVFLAAEMILLSPWLAARSARHLQALAQTDVPLSGLAEADDQQSFST